MESLKAVCFMLLVLSVEYWNKSKKKKILKPMKITITNISLKKNHPKVGQHSMFILLLYQTINTKVVKGDRTAGNFCEK